MSWRDRPYSTDNDYDAQPGHRGARSWVGGLPPLSKAVKWIMLANVILFLLCEVTGGLSSPIFQWLAMETPAVFHGQVWRLFTFTYLHDPESLWHIFMNMLGLYFLGVPLEQRWGSRRFFGFYTLGGFVAVLMYLLVTEVAWLSPNGTLVGASGGVLAVMGACAVLFPEMQLILVLFPVPIRAAVLIFVALYGFNLWQKGDNAGGDACHLAGLAFGIVWGYRGAVWMRGWDNWRRNVEQRTRESRQRQQQDLYNEVDRILAKIQRDGIASLTGKEKRTLETATKLQRGEGRFDDR